MNKAELVAAVAARAEMTKVDAKRAVDAFIAATSASLKNDEKVTLVGFGTFVVAKRKARTGRNPRTGDPLKIKAKRVVKFRPGAGLQ